MLESVSCGKPGGYHDSEEIIILGTAMRDRKGNSLRVSIAQVKGQKGTDGLLVLLPTQPMLGPWI